MTPPATAQARSNTSSFGNGCMVEREIVAKAVAAGDDQSFTEELLKAELPDNFYGQLLNIETPEARVQGPLMPGETSPGRPGATAVERFGPGSLDERIERVREEQRRTMERMIAEHDPPLSADQGERELIGGLRGLT